ncbi:hypothetical protein NVP1055O_02 [Vibrio phage 1.055.O._10N.286.55.E9]|nr:hypothetical protein NVP1055O_02 [Vibrio phage 1.055.O._10N.286.55.E9]
MDLKIGCRVKPSGCRDWYRVASVGNDYVTLHNYMGVVWFSEIEDIRE